MRVHGNEIDLSGEDLVHIARAVLAQGTDFRFEARGSSMAPLLCDGDVVTVSPVSHTSLRVGDVVAGIHPATGKLVVHRVVEKRPEGCVIRGDGCSEPDGLVANRNILGRVSRVERNGKGVLWGWGLERVALGHLNRIGIVSVVLRLARGIMGIVRRGLQP